MTTKTARADQRALVRLLDVTLETMPYGLSFWSDAFQLVRWNRLYLDIYGFPPDRIWAGMPYDDLVHLSFELGHHQDISEEAYLTEAYKTMRASRTSKRIIRRTLKDGRTVQSIQSYAEDLGWMTTHEDITDEIRAAEHSAARERDLAQRHVWLDAAVNNITQGLAMFDAAGCLVICNRSYAQMYELPNTLVARGTRIEDIMRYLYQRGLNKSQRAHTLEEYMTWRRGVIQRGEYFQTTIEHNGRVIMLQHHPIKEGGFVTTHEDISEQRRQEARIRHLASHDALTELPNRAMFLEEMADAEIALARSERIAVLCIDLDRFKSVNDTLGHTIGDEVLKQAATRLKGAVRDRDLLARLGGDEFSIILHDISDPTHVAAIAERIVKFMKVPFSIDTHEIVIGASVGVAVAPGDGETAEALIKNADLALYRAKADGRSTFAFFEPDMDAAMQRRRTIEGALRAALLLNEFRLVFQPLVGLVDDRISGFEALLRWTHDGKNIPPGEFISIAEETGLIIPIGEWVLREACKMAAGWPDHIRIAVNLSPIQFKSARLYETIATVLVETKLLPNRLDLEITESLLLNDNTQTLETLHRLRALGIRISMDDFGTGYSSLSYLRSFPFDKIKIDRSFMTDLESNGESQEIIKAVIGLGRSLGMTTTAEGVETEEQLQTVREQGCNEVQGYLFSPPVEGNAVADLLRPGPAAHGQSGKLKRAG